MKKILPLLFLLAALFGLSACSAKPETIALMPLVEQQMALGPRTPGSDAHQAFVDQTVTALKAAGWTVEDKNIIYQGKEVRNIVADRISADENARWIVIGAHFDSRLQADQESAMDNRLRPVPGANDGASGVAVLLGLAQTLPTTLNKSITLAFFDAEDQGRITGWPDWCLGSRALAEEYGALERKPDAVIVLDMIGDADLNVYRERNSDPQLTDELFSLAGKLGYSDKFINTAKYAMTDDHTPFLEQGIPAADLIDFDYTWWHTLGDTADKLSEESLQAVYRLIFTYLTQK